MKVTMLLADSAQTSSAEGKLHILGAGWNLIGPEPSPHAVALIVEVDWNAANQPHTLVMELHDADGQPVRLGPDGTVPRVEAQFEIGRPAGHPDGQPLNVPMAFNFGPIPLPAAQRYVWVVSIDGETSDHWRAGFNTRPGAPEAPPPG